MNKTIKEQLKNCVVANVPPFDDNTTKLLIKKGGTERVTQYQLHKCYVVDIDLDAVKKSNLTNIPDRGCYKCEIAQIMGNMVRILGCGYDRHNDIDYSDIWEGWIPTDCITIIKEII